MLRLDSLYTTWNTCLSLFYRLYDIIQIKKTDCSWKTTWDSLLLELKTMTMIPIESESENDDTTVLKNTTEEEIQ